MKYHRFPCLFFPADVIKKKRKKMSQNEKVAVASAIQHINVYHKAGRINDIQILTQYKRIFTEDRANLEHLKSADKIQQGEIDKTLAILQMLIGQIDSIILMNPPDLRVSTGSGGGIGGTTGTGGAAGGTTGTGGQQDSTVAFDCPAAVKKARNLPNRTFVNVIGMQQEKLEFRVGFIYPFLYPNLFPQGKAILMFGNAGGGKTQIASALPREMSNILQNDYRKAGGGIIDTETTPLIYFFSLTGADLKGPYVGSTERLIQGAFDCAQATAISNPAVPATSIVFIDEIDVIGGSRKKGDANTTSSVTSLLTAMQGTTARPNIRVIGATNQIQELDEAVLSRFPIKILVDTPGDLARAQLMVREIVQGVNLGRASLFHQLKELIKKYNENKTEANLIPVIQAARYFTVQYQDEPDYANWRQTFKDYLELSPDKQKDQAQITALLGVLDNAMMLKSKQLKYVTWEDLFRKIDLSSEKASGGDNSFGQWLSQNPDLIPKNPSPKQVSDLVIQWLVVQTGANMKGRQRLYHAFSHVVNGKKMVDEFLMKGGKRTMGGRSEFGYSNRDLTNFVTYILGKAALRVLNRKRDNCVIELSDDEKVKCDQDAKSCLTQCPPMSKADRDFLRPTEIDLTDLTDALDNVPSGVIPKDYVTNVLYKFQEEAQSETMGQIREKEKEIKSEAEILIGHLFEDSVPDTVIQIVNELPEKLQQEKTVLQVAARELLKAKNDDVIKAFKDKLMLPSIKKLYETMLSLISGDKERSEELKRIGSK
jgi:hypothetical protein